MKLLKLIGGVFLSLRTSLWLLGAQLVLFLYGAFAMPLQDEFSRINSGALFDWLRANPLSVTWWLWASVLVLGLMAVNTVVCSVDAIIRKRQQRHWLLVISPQIIHIGFMFMLLAHLLSATGATKGKLHVREGMYIRLTNDFTVKVASLKVKLTPQGHPMDWRADIQYFKGTKLIDSDYLAPNKPSFFEGFGIYIMNVMPYPVTTAHIEINREPGAPWALVGGVLYTLGTVALVMLKIRREK